MLDLEDLKTNLSFCILPFIHQEKQFNNYHNICCYENRRQSDHEDQNSYQSFNSKKIVRIRKQMLAGIRPPECSGCYTKEDIGLQSPRQFETSLWFENAKITDKIKTIITRTINNEDVVPISFDLRYSNTCSLKCRMCNSGSSSAINAEYKKINNLWSDKFWFADNLRVNHDIELTSDIEKIYLAGGEPLIESYNLELLKKLLHVNPEVQLLINTSLNNLDSKFIEIFDSFKNLLLVISIDGLGKLNEYIRHGSIWNTVIKNIETLQKHQLMFSTTVSMYNIFNITELIKFLSDNYPNAIHGVNIVNDVEELYVENLPLELRPPVISDLKSTLEWAPAHVIAGVQNLIKLLEINNFSSERFANFIKYTTILDKVRGESVTDIQPKFAKYFKD